MSNPPPIPVDPEAPREGRRRLQDGDADGLQPLHPLDPEQVTSCSELLEAMSRTAFSGRALGEAADIMQEMIRDPRCYVVCTVSGAMTVAKMGLVLCRMIEYGMVDCIIATGALITHGLTEAIGLTHYKVPPGARDADLFRAGYNRVYDTLEMEKNLNDVEHDVHAALEALPEGQPLCSEALCAELGRLLSRKAAGSGVLRSAWEYEVPVYVPAFTDSELGLDVATWAMRRSLRKARAGGPEFRLWRDVPSFNPYLDLLSYARRIQDTERLGIFTIGGGVPRNWAQQAPPFFELVSDRLELPDVKIPRFRYGVRICPEPVHWGGLSGCTYSEGSSWGKMIPAGEGGRFAEVYADATVAWPILIRALIERLGPEGRRPPRRTG